MGPVIYLCLTFLLFEMFLPKDNKSVICWGKNLLEKMLKHVDLVKHLRQEIASQYTKVNSNLPLITEKSIENKLLREWKKYKGFVKANTTTSSSKYEDYSSKLNKIFNIISCKCPILICESFGCSGCSEKVHLLCACKD